jgi:hypothetical protein
MRNMRSVMRNPPTVLMVAQVTAMAPHWKDEAKLITAAKQGRRQLEEQFAQEREEARLRQARAGWSGLPKPDDDEE